MFSWIFTGLKIPELHPAWHCLITHCCSKQFLPPPTTHQKIYRPNLPNSHDTEQNNSFKMLTRHFHELLHVLNQTVWLLQRDKVSYSQWKLDDFAKWNKLSYAGTVHASLLTFAAGCQTCLGSFSVHYSLPLIFVKERIELKDQRLSWVMAVIKQNRNFLTNMTSTSLCFKGLESPSRDLNSTWPNVWDAPFNSENNGGTDTHY